MTSPESKRPPPQSLYPHSVRTAQVRSRAILAVVCATLIGASIVSAFMRACEGDDQYAPSANH